MDNLLHQNLSNIKGQNVVLSISHKKMPETSFSTDFNQTVRVLDFFENRDGVELVFENNVTILIPDKSVVRVGTESIEIKYETVSKQEIIIELTPIEENKFSEVVEPIKEPLVKEHRDAEGVLSKIIIDIPVENIKKEQLIAVKEFLSELLSEWGMVSLAKRSAGASTFVFKNALFKGVSVLEIPGESFLQILCVRGEDIKEIDIPTQFIVNMKYYNVAFDFDGVPYEITKSSR